MSRRDQIMDAAISFGAREFTMSELVVECWRRDKQAFGLAGFEYHYPDSNRVIAKVAGATGLVARGRLLHVGSKRYQVPRGALTDSPERA